MEETITNLVLAAVLFIKLLLLFLQRRSFFRSSCILNLEILVVAVSRCPHSLMPLNWHLQGEADSDHQDLMMQTALIALLLMQMDWS